MDDYADCFAGFLRALRFESVHLVGLSFGAAMVLATFHRHRDVAASLALVSGYAGWSGSLGSAQAEERLTLSLRLSELPSEQFVAAMVPSMFSASAEKEVVATFAESVRTFSPDGFRAMARAAFTDQSHVLSEVDVPMLLLYADHDVRAPVAIGEAMHETVPNSQLVMLRGAGHVSSVEAPNEVTRELRRFLSSVS
jgi:pimeloyl-ACP methyl ester carboxylesterase